MKTSDLKLEMIRQSPRQTTPEEIADMADDLLNCMLDSGEKETVAESLRLLWYARLERANNERAQYQPSEVSEMCVEFQTIMRKLGIAKL